MNGNNMSDGSNSRQGSSKTNDYSQMMNGNGQTGEQGIYQGGRLGPLQVQQRLSSQGLIQGQMNYGIAGDGGTEGSDGSSIIGGDGIGMGGLPPQIKRSYSFNNNT